METRMSFGGQPRFIWLSMGILLLLLLPRTAKADNVFQALKHVHLSPFWQWRTAYECMVPNATDPCSYKERLTLNGSLVLNQTEVGNFCKNGCWDYTKVVLTCIDYAKRDFWFANKATVKNINDSITNACASSSALNTNYKTSSATRMFRPSWFAFLTSSLATLAILGSISV